MVGPISESERAAFRRRLKIGLAGLVSLSAGLVAVQVDATLLQIVGAMVVGLPVGIVLAWYIVPSQAPPADRRRYERQENPFPDGSGGTDDSERDEDRHESNERRRGR